MKIRPVGAELFHAGGRTDGQTDMTKIVVAFRSFANVHRQEARFQNRYVIYCDISCRKAIRIRTVHRKQTSSRTEGCTR